MIGDKSRAAELVLLKKKQALLKKQKEKHAAALLLTKRALLNQTDLPEKRAGKLAVAKQTQESQYARSLIEASLDPLVTISVDGKILDVNEASIKVTGKPRTKLIGTNFSNYFTDPKKAQKGYLQAFEKGFVSDYALTIKHVNGKLTDVLYNASVYKDDHGNVLGVFAAARDVTEQKHASQYARSLIEASLDPLVTININGKITDVNEASIKVTGIPRERLINTDFSDYFTEPKKAQAGYRQVFDKGFVADYPLTIKHKKGKLTDVLYNASIYKDDKGNVLGVFAAARDVTEQIWAKDLRIANIELAFQNNEKEKRAAELILTNKELNLSEKSLQNSLKEVSDYKYSLDESAIIALTDQKGIIKKANRNFCKISKYKEEELIGEDHRIVSSGYHSKEFIRDLWMTIASGKIWKGEIKNKAKDGSFYWVDTTIVPFLDEQGKPYQYLAIRLDISKRKESEEQLKMVNKDLAFQNDEKGKRAAELSIANNELSFQNEEKEKRAAELIVANMELAFQNGEKEKRAKELSIANAELAFQNEEKEKRAAELIVVNKELVAFTYISSHDLQEPIRKIQTLAGRILETENENLSKNGKDYFQRLQASAKRMQLLLTDLLAFSRVNSGEIKFETTDLKSLMKEVKNDFKERIEAIHATFEINQLGTANIVPTQFRQLIQNLLGNALKFSKPDKPPHIIVHSKVARGSELYKEKMMAPQLRRLSGDRSYFHITFSDNGIGFEPEFNEQIFEVFQRLHSKKEYEGTGIGLAIVKKIVENHNGIIIATSELDKGATFDIYIPN